MQSVIIRNSQRPKKKDFQCVHVTKWIQIFNCRRGYDLYHSYTFLTWASLAVAVLVLRTWSHSSAVLATMCGAWVRACPCPGLSSSSARLAARWPAAPGTVAAIIYGRRKQQHNSHCAFQKTIWAKWLNRAKYVSDLFRYPVAPLQLSRIIKLSRGTIHLCIGACCSFWSVSRVPGSCSPGHRITVGDWCMCGAFLVSRRHTAWNSRPRLPSLNIRHL